MKYNVVTEIPNTQPLTLEEAFRRGLWVGAYCDTGEQGIDGCEAKYIFPISKDNKEQFEICCNHLESYSGLTYELYSTDVVFNSISEAINLLKEEQGSIFIVAFDTKKELLTWWADI